MELDTKRNPAGSVALIRFVSFAALLALGAGLTEARAQERRVRRFWDVPTRGRTMSPGADVTGRLTGADALFESFEGAAGMRLQAWEFSASAGTVLRVRGFAADFELVLQVVGDFVDHDYGGNSGFCNVELVLAIERTVRHKLIVGGPADSLGSGVYRLRF